MYDTVAGHTGILVGVSLVVLYLTYYLLQVAKKPVLICGEGEFREFLERSLPLLHRRHWSTPWCAGGRMQTALGGLLRSRIVPPVSWERELLALQDGGTAALLWGPRPARARGTLLLLPGLAGGARADYLRLLAAAAERLRLRAAVLLPRGRGAPLTSPRLFSAVSQADAGAAVAALRARGAGPVLGAGVSLGGLLLANLAAERGAECGLAGALLLSAPLDVPAADACLARERLLSRHMAAGLRAAVARHPELAERHGPGWRAARSVREFDAAFTSPHFGFADVDAYYRAATPRLAAVRVPVLAADDPLQPARALPRAAVEGARRVAVLQTARGGHAGWLTGWWPARDPARHFMSEVAVQYLGALLSRPDLMHRTD